MSNLPYVISPGNVPKALEAIIAAATPEKVSQNFVKTILKIPGSSGDQMTSFLKKIGFADSGGSPTEIYRKFRNEAERGWAAAESLKYGYASLYRKNEFLHELSEKDLKGIILEETGLSAESKVPSYILSCIKALKKYADFAASAEPDLRDSEASEHSQNLPRHYQFDDEPASRLQDQSRAIGLNLGYTINLNLPPTTDIAVFNAIFKSLKENLLKDDDG